MRIFTFIIVIIVLLLGVSFAILNANVVAIDYYFGSAQLPLSLFLVFALIIGAILGLFVSNVMFFKAKAVQYHLRKQLANAQKEIKNLHKIPLEDK